MELNRSAQVDFRFLFFLPFKNAYVVPIETMCVCVCVIFVELFNMVSAKRILKYFSIFYYLIGKTFMLAHSGYQFHFELVT